MRRMAVDVGGTFTDIVYIDEDTMQVKFDKARSTPDAPIRGIMESIHKINPEMSKIAVFIFGSTVGLNTLLQKKGAKVGLLTTQGFTDVLEMARGDRKELYNYLWKKPAPLVPRRLRLGVNERTSYAGQIIKAVDEEEVEKLIERMANDRVEAVAVCLLHSYANPENEQKIRKALARVFPPEAISLSHEVVQEFREYERTSTTVLDAYIKKPVVTGLAQLEKNLGDMGFTGQLLIASPSGVLGPLAVRQKAIATLNSGPIGGAAGAAYLANLMGLKNLVTMDVGGTSFDISIINEGRSLEKYEVELAGYPVLLPGIDVRSIGAGGGSIARIDAGGMLQVGPQSAGAVPGPMCYGLGGLEPTVTDAAVVNGLIDPGCFAGGEINLDMDLARKGIDDLSKRLGLDIHRTAAGILTIARNNMTTTTSEILIGQGYDPRDFAIISFGGGGGLFSTIIAREMGITRVIVPANPAVFCAWGMLTMNLVHSYSQTLFRSMEALNMRELKDIYRGMEERGLKMLEEEKIDRDAIEFIRSLDICYEGQGHYVEVTLGKDEWGEGVRSKIIEAFHYLHKVKYGHRMDVPPRLINARLKAVGKIKEMRLSEIKQGKRVQPGAVKTKRAVYLDGGFIECDIFDRNKLLGGNVIKGPAIIEEAFHVTVVMPGQFVSVDKFGNLIIDTGVKKG